MAMSRWKGMAGVLGLAIGGLAATADSPNPIVPLNSQACHDSKPRMARSPSGTLPLIPPAPSVETIQVAFQPPQLVPPPTPSEAPTVAPVAVQPAVAAVPLPSLNTPPVPGPAPELPAIVSLPPATPDLPAVARPEESKKPLENVLEISLPIVKDGVKLEKPTQPVKDTPPTLTPIPVAAPATSQPINTVKSVPVDLPGVVQVGPSVTAMEPARPSLTSTLDKKDSSEETSTVRVVLRLGVGQPRFEVLSGEDTLLKVVCDKVDVRSSGPSSSKRDTTMTPLKALGQIRFSAPGCEGSCDELTVSPMTGEVVVSGHVQVRCKRGKGETEIQGGEMRFKLGTAPAYTVADPTESNIVQTRFGGSK